MTYFKVISHYSPGEFVTKVEIRNGDTAHVQSVTAVTTVSMYWSETFTVWKKFRVICLRASGISSEKTNN